MASVEKPSLPGVYAGNANYDGDSGWFVGQFVAPEVGLRRQEDVEIKWGVHPAGDMRGKGWSLNRTSTTISILVEGEIYISFLEGESEKTVHLKRQGDYVICTPGVYHTWYSDQEAVVITIRTPSVNDDQRHLEPGSVTSV